jgi:hypothetical protein
VSSKSSQQKNATGTKEAVWFQFCGATITALLREVEFLEACRTGDLERVKQLLEEGVDINTRDRVCLY